MNGLDSYQDDREFLRSVVNKPHDALTALEFMRVWGIANRALQSGPLRSESGETFLGENDYREALLYAQVTMRDLAAGKPVRDLDEQLSRIEMLLDGHIATGERS